MKILGIETSCDETGVAIYDSKKNIILSEKIYSQASKHSEYGGVVPELASRDHIPKLLPLITLGLKEANLSPSDLDGIAYTSGPGLRGPLLTGAALAHSLSLGWDKPCIGINHMEAHLLINLLEEPPPLFPFLTLLISGGHCLLIKASDVGKYQILGETRDDAVGEAFDKVAKLLDLKYPGGPEIEKMAKLGNPMEFDLPRPMINQDHLDFSFSGLKTAVYYLVKKQNRIEEKFVANISSSFQRAVCETLIKKCKRALRDNNLNQLVIGGGVAANQYLRATFKKELKGVDLYFPPLERCTDNGAMVAVAGSYRFKESKTASSIKIRPKWNLSEV
tara:strand:+ start:996 stop:1997 length:1002 start_codon:yes stop_codon:yes gene_type:complete